MASSANATTSGGEAHKVEIVTDIELAKFRGNLTICDEVIPLLTALAAAKGNFDSEMEIGRSIRLSTHFRREIAESVRKLLSRSPVLKDDLVASQKCMYLLSLADRSKANDSSHLLRLPRELRDRIFAYTMGVGLRCMQMSPCGLQTESDDPKSESSPGATEKSRICDSAIGLQMSKFFYGRTKKMKPVPINLLSVSRQVSAEATISFYRYNDFAVTCTCKLHELLSREVVRNAIRNVRFGLFGSQRVKAINLLGQCRLENLTVTIGRMSTHVVNAQERYFRECGLTRITNPVRLSVADGVIEMQGFGFKKGIEAVVVKLGSERTEQERAGFEKFINKDPKGARFSPSI